MTEQRDGVGALASLVGYHLRRASSAFASDFAAAVEGTGMRQVLVGILVIISDNPGINQGSAGRVLGIKRANMVSLINELIDAELVDRVVDASDRRAFTLTLSDAGHAKLAECLALINVHEQDMMSDFSSAEKAMLLELLGRIVRRERPVT